MPSDFHSRANLGLVVRGPILSLQIVLDELQRFVASHPGLDLVYSKVSANRIYIEEEG